MKCAYYGRLALRLAQTTRLSRLYRVHIISEALGAIKYKICTESTAPLATSHRGRLGQMWSEIIGLAMCQYRGRIFPVVEITK